jgi:hypothetical protein
MLGVFSEVISHFKEVNVLATASAKIGGPNLEQGNGAIQLLQVAISENMVCLAAVITSSSTWWHTSLWLQSRGNIRSG